MENHHHNPERKRGHHHHSADASDLASMVAVLDLDGEVLHEYLTDVVAWVHELAGDHSGDDSGDDSGDLPRRRILDLGCGTGTGTLALAERFKDAEVTGVDQTEQFLERLTGKARELGLADRVHTLQADLDGPWPAVDTVDVVWASSSLHHLADPQRVLADVFATLRPGGLLAVAEIDSLPRFLPDDLGPGFGEPGLEERCRAAMSAARAEDMPLLGADWGPILSGAGFAIVAERPFVVDLKHPLPASTGRYAQETFRRIRSGVADRLGAEDLAALDALVDGDGPGSIARRDDLTVRTTRTVWAATRP